MPNKADQLVGKVTHYFSNIGVAVIELSNTLRVGDSIKIVGGGEEFNQAVHSMENERQKIETAERGESIGLKVSQKVREGYNIYKI